jgi:hypothetical protein
MEADRRMSMFVEGNGLYANWLAFVTPMTVTVEFTPTVEGGTSISWRAVVPRSC